MEKFQLVGFCLTVHCFINEEEMETSVKDFFASMDKNG